MRVLVIDDDQDFRASVKSLLESHDFTVVEADSGKEGLRKLVECKPDLIILDVMMECCDEGYGVAHAIKYKEAYAGYRHIPILMVSSIEESPDERFPMSPEVEMIRPDLYLSKPLQVDKFLEVVGRTVAR